MIFKDQIMKKRYNILLLMIFLLGFVIYIYTQSSKDSVHIVDHTHMYMN